MRLRHAGATDVGRKRNHNEDRYLIQPEDNLFVVCDGMGGHASGEVAAQRAVDEISKFFAESRTDREITWPFKPDRKVSDPEAELAVSIKMANWQVHQMAAEDLRYKGMGTTCVGIHVEGTQVAIAHVGDSRCYRIRDGRIEPMTVDHSLIEEYRRMAQVTEEEVKNFPHKNIILRALGMKERVEVETRLEELRVGDIYLLCCDGLSGEVEDQEMLAVVREMGHDLDRCCKELVARANQHGGRDNITVVLVKAEDERGS
ncbi:MAG TPA: Stp1/IreP family PP2C-type Ser/Thr phosphatase [Myxococcota bacterium]|nr:Stp1/IreP family PP2C-type Ser/Thr phosphatase [Myxococcota bacterium]HQK52520.1 Stp1/IreP family PP2C-type Ser/Thr phosphatase [Myxococcota bacterium]